MTKVVGAILKKTTNRGCKTQVERKKHEVVEPVKLPRNCTARRFVSKSWCGRKDLNLHEGTSYAPEAYASANSATPAWVEILLQFGKLMQ